MGPLNFTHLRATTFTLTLVPSHSPNENTRPDKSEISHEQSQPVCTRSPKESRLFFLNSLSWGVSTFCIFQSQAFEGWEKHWGSFCGLKEKLSAAENLSRTSLLFSLSTHGAPYVCFIRGGAPCVDETDCVSPGGRQVGIWNMLATCNIVFVASSEILSCSDAEGAETCSVSFL